MTGTIELQNSPNTGALMKAPVVMSILLIAFVITIPVIFSISAVSATATGDSPGGTNPAHYPQPGYPSPPSTFYLSIVQNNLDGSRLVPVPTATPLPTATPTPIPTATATPVLEPTAPAYP
jgi:hypothetical protein